VSPSASTMAQTLPRLEPIPRPRHRVDELAREHRDALRAVAVRICKSRDEAEDLVQDALERAVARADDLDPARTWSWLVTVMHHRFIDQCRARRRQRELADEPAAQPAIDDGAPRPAWDHIGVDDVRAAVSDLEPGFRAVFEMHAFEGRSYDEIATAAAIPRSTVGTRLLRARSKLRTILAARHGLADDGSQP
jgi:RNA polymerase sigma-70 factor (ECF subfamily)